MFFLLRVATFDFVIRSAMSPGNALPVRGQTPQDVSINEAVVNADGQVLYTEKSFALTRESLG